MSGAPGAWVYCATCGEGIDYAEIAPVDGGYQVTITDSAAARHAEGHGHAPIPEVRAA